uniref:ZAD domain-containing protein n=1 Tax=Anopheles atroparvus TaxID=41427 RepID=A0AAG5DCX8_ANOAO
MSSENKLCRTCLGEGTRHIFQPYVYNDKWCSVASINYIVDKLRYVLMLPITEHDGLPLWICELCLVQLNLAYNFKRRAIEREKNLPLLVGGSKQHSVPDIGNAITYDKPVSDGTIQVNPTVKLEATSDDCDHLNDPTGRSTQPTSEESAFPRIVSVVSYSTGYRDDPTIGAPTPSPTLPGMVMLNTDQADPAEDAAFLQSFRNTPDLTASHSDSKTGRDPLQDKTTTQQNHSSSSAVIRKGKTHRKPLKKSKKKVKPDNEQPRTNEQKHAKTPSIKDKLSTVMRSLEIDMVTKKPTRGRDRSCENSSLIETSDLPIAKKVKIRRNSVCVPSYRE